jgi:pulcherriminic acid synthase
MTTEPQAPAPGRNNVAIKKPLGGRGGHYRTYEIHQRQRPRDMPVFVNPRWSHSPEVLRDPYPTLAHIRENYECYRDWVNNADWVMRYNDVTSIFVDDANFETRPKLWYYAMEGYGRDLRDELPYLWAWANGVEVAGPRVARLLIDGFRGRGAADLVEEFSSRYPAFTLAAALGLPEGDWPQFATWHRQMNEGVGWDPRRELAGRQAMASLAEYVRPLLAARRAAPAGDAISAFATLEVEGGPTTAEDLVTTLLEDDGDTLFAGLANQCFLLLTNPDELRTIIEKPLFVKHAWQETLRHSAPMLHARRYARNEVERFGRLIPEGGLVMCSAAAANRDPRIFDEPDRFDVTRKDLCFREPRGQYRADGLPAAVTPGLGKPTHHPAVPEDRPRSRYAITTDLAVIATTALIEALPGLRLASGAEPTLTCRWVWDMHSCWSLPAVWDT